MLVENKFVIVGKSQCKYCTMAKELLAAKGYEFEYKSLDNDPDLLIFVKESLGARSVPQIQTPEGRWIGGFQDLQKYLNVVQ